MTRLFIILTAFLPTVVYGQAKDTLDPDTRKKLTMLVDSLTGEWELYKVICYSNGDSLVQEPSPAPMGMNASRPPTTILFDTSQSFKISQWCMKCPFLQWTGKYSVSLKERDRFEYFYLTFAEKRDKYLKKNEKSFTQDFNGYLTNFENNTIQLTDSKGCNLIYKRKQKEPKTFFNKDQPFEIINSKHGITNESSDKDTSKCKGWTIPMKTIPLIIRDSKVISGNEWHDYFGVFSCIISGQLNQNGQIYNYEINGGSWITISKNGKWIYLGSFRKEYEKYFIDKAWDSK